MATEVKLPRLGQGMESGTIVRWLKTEGEAVSKGEPLYELDTDKVTQEVEAESDGVLLKIVIADGEVDVGTTVGIIGAQDEDVAALLADSQGGNGDAPAATAAAPVSETPALSPPSDAAPAGEAKVEEPAQSSTTPRAPGEHVKASPLARRIAREQGVDIRQIAGTGPEGRVIAEDVENAAARRGGCGRRSGVPRRRDRRAHLYAQDDRPPPHGGVAGSGLPAHRHRGCDRARRNARAHGRAAPRG